MNATVRIMIIVVALLTGLGIVVARVIAQPDPRAINAQPDVQVIKVTAKRFVYTPNQITLKKGVPVVLELRTEDVLMGFNAPDLGARADIIPGQVTRVRIVPDKVGNFSFFCDVFCGSGHEEMTGTIVVTA